MLNKIFLQGRLVNDPEVRQTPAGVSVTTFRIAVDRDRKNKDTGEKETDFVTVVAWRSTAEFIYKYFSKGRMAIIDGRLQMRNYTDKDGIKRTAAEVVADNIYFGDSKKEDDPMTGLANNIASYGVPSPSVQFAELSDENDGELPF